jgi:hypothetical protein
MQINARATYGISFGGSNPQIFLPDRNSSSSADNSIGQLPPNNREWILYLPKAYHPLLLNSHRANSQKAKEDVDTSVKSQIVPDYHFFSTHPLYFPFSLSLYY